MTWLCDPTVLRLGRELRALGFPAESCRGDLTFPQAGSVLVTRSGRLFADRDLRALPRTVLLKSDDLMGQLSSLESLFRITRAARPWTLCVRCGGDLERHPPERFRDEAPPFVVETTEWIARCLRCGHLFWRATHTDRQEAFWRQVFGFVPGVAEGGHDEIG